ncbi:hypothetical protein [Gordonia alkaliphila]|uniref:Uncharacterized protein n=1 Tax=Gordonia alkaliphila TaxID=1053547 RepID=A0ABP8Z2W8_9ACTN
MRTLTRPTAMAGVALAAAGALALAPLASAAPAHAAAAPILEQVVANQVTSAAALATGGEQAVTAYIAAVNAASLPSLESAATNIAAGKVDVALMNLFVVTAAPTVASVVALLGPIQQVATQPLNNLQTLGANGMDVVAGFGLGMFSGDVVGAIDDARTQIAGLLGAPAVAAGTFAPEPANSLTVTLPGLESDSDAQTAPARDLTVDTPAPVADAPDTSGGDLVGADAQSSSGSGEIDLS